MRKIFLKITKSIKRIQLAFHKEKVKSAFGPRYSPWPDDHKPPGVHRPAVTIKGVSCWQRPTRPVRHLSGDQTVDIEHQACRNRGLFHLFISLSCKSPLSTCCGPSMVPQSGDTYPGPQGVHGTGGKTDNQWNYISESKKYLTEEKARREGRTQDSRPGLVGSWCVW